MDYGEGTKHQLHLVLLGWEQQFDKALREEMFNAMERMDIDAKLIKLD